MSVCFGLAVVTEQAYQAAMAKVEKHAQQRDKYHKEAEEAYQKGDKDKARDLRGNLHACSGYR